jgi:hypothetical protein
MSHTIEVPIKKCRGKFCFTKKSAETTKNKLFKIKGHVVRIYQCNLCNYWHLTHKQFEK